MSGPNGFSEKLAIFYEATHDYGDVGDESFYLDVATTADGPVLEGACGSGRIYLELLRRGVDADGFDASAAPFAQETTTAQGNETAKRLTALSGSVREHLPFRRARHEPCDS